MRSAPLGDALVQSRTQPYLVGMGEPRHALEFRRKLRIDEQVWPLHVVGGSGMALGGGAPPVYKELGLMHMGTLYDVYTKTADVGSVISALRAVATGHLPTYDSGGDLTQLGGTLLLESLPLDPEAADDEPVTPLMHHIEDKTGGHMPAGDLANALLGLPN